MSEILFHYHKVNPTTWVYLASLLMIGLYFKFGRFWSVRNLDLVLLILLAPGLLIAQYGGEQRLDAARRVAMETPGVATPPDRPAAGPDGFAAEQGAPLETPQAASGAMPKESPTALVEQNPDAGPVAEERGEQEQRSEAADALSDAEKDELFGFLWLFAIGAIWLVRLLLDPTMVRRPLLEPNLTTGGLIFIGVSLFVFLMANVWTSQRSQGKPPALPKTLERVAATRAAGSSGEEEEVRRGPGYALLNLIPSISTMPMVQVGTTIGSQEQTYAIIAKVIAILCHLAVVLGIVAIGYWHFGNTKTGAGVAALYLMLPYTAQMTGYIDHVIPAALLVWAILCYRRPLTSGMLLGLATGLVYYPAVPPAVVGQLLLAPRADAVCDRSGGHAGGDGRRAGVHSARFVLGELEADVRALAAAAGGLAGHLGAGLEPGLPHPGAGRLRCPERYAGAVACAEEPGHPAQLFGGRDGRHAVLARLRGRAVHRLVSAFDVADRLPTQPGRPRGAGRAWAKVGAGGACRTC